MSPKVSIIPICTAILLNTSIPAKSDSGHIVIPDGTKISSASGAALATIEFNGSCFSVTVKGAKKYRSVFSYRRFKSGELLLSNDGKTAVWMLSPHFYGSLWIYDRKNGLSLTESIWNGPALIFYRDGKQIKSYSLKDLLVRPRLVSMSVSHTQWLPERQKSDLSRPLPAVTFAPDGSKLEIETTSFRHYVFDPATGSMTVAGDSDIYQKSDLIVYGELVWRDKRWALKEPKLIKGKASDLSGLVFDDPTMSYCEGYSAVALIKKGGNWHTMASYPEFGKVYNVLK